MAFATKNGRIGKEFKAPLLVDHAREIVQEMSVPPVGDKVTMLLLDLEDVDDKVQDTLLKTLEEPLGEEVALVLYTVETSGLRDTLWSRVHAQWCPGPYQVPHELISKFKGCKNDFAEIVKVLKDLEPKDDLIGAVSAMVQGGQWSPRVWLEFRSAGRGRVDQVSRLLRGLLSKAPEV